MLNFRGVSQNDKMDGENNGKPYVLMDDLGDFGGNTIFGNIHMDVIGCLVGFVNGSMVNGSVGFFHLYLCMVFLLKL